MYLVTYLTESMDRGFYLFKKRPTKIYLEKFFKNIHSEEFTDKYKYIGWQVCQIEFED